MGVCPWGALVVLTPVPSRGGDQVESALVLHDDVVEAAVVGCEHDVKGEAVYCFVTLKVRIAQLAV